LLYAFNAVEKIQILSDPIKTGTVEKIMTYNEGKLHQKYSQPKKSTSFHSPVCYNNAIIKKKINNLIKAFIFKPDIIFNRL
jgi:hypothetical protein